MIEMDFRKLNQGDDCCIECQRKDDIIKQLRLKIKELEDKYEKDMILVSTLESSKIVIKPEIDLYDDELDHEQVINENTYLEPTIKIESLKSEFSSEVNEGSCYIEDDVDRDLNTDNSNLLSTSRAQSNNSLPIGECEMLFSCNLCCKTFPSKTKFNEHKNIAHEQKVLSCDVCKQSFVSKSDIDEHSLKCDGKIEESIETDCGKPCEASHVCSLCNKTFHNLSNFIRHRFKHQGVRFACSICGETFGDKSSVARHKKRVHLRDKSEKLKEASESNNDIDDAISKNKNKKSSNKKKQNPPDLTKIKFVGSLTNEEGINYYANIITESINDNSTCKVCHKKFFDKHTLIKHLAVHGIEHRYYCNECDHSFRRKMELNKHKIVHTGGSLHSCSLCQETFTKLVSLEQHLIKHRGETPYACDLCDQKFSTKKRLYGHRKIHTEMHTCDICDKSFSRNKDLRVHKMEHGEKKKFVCDHCPYSFTYKVMLDKHMLTHTGEKPFVCHVCGKGFAQKDKVKSHIISMHPEEQT